MKLLIIEPYNFIKTIWQGCSYELIYENESHVTVMSSTGSLRSYSKNRKNNSAGDPECENTYSWRGY